MDKYRSNLKIIVIFLLPAFLIYVFLAVFPILQSFYFAFFKWAGVQGMPLEYAGINNFIRLFDSQDFIRSLSNSAKFIVLNIVLQLPLGYFLALLLSSFCKGYRFFKTVFFSSVILPVTATALLWKFIFGPNETGLLNVILSSVGLGSMSNAWLIYPKTALLSIIIANAWTGFGYHMVIGFAAITGIPAELLESAAIDGAVGIRKVFLIIIPLIWESIKISTILIIIGSVKIFDIVYIMTEGGPNGLTHVPSTLLYQEAFRYNNYGVGSAISAIIFVISILLTLVSMRLMRRDKIEY